MAAKRADSAAHEGARTRHRPRTPDLLQANEELRAEIDRRKLIEAELTTGLDRYRAVADLTNDFTYSLRFDGNGRLEVEWVAGAFTQICGYTAAEIAVAGSWDRLIHPDDREIAAAHKRRIEEGQSAAVEIRIVTKGGEIRWLRQHDRAEREAGGSARILGGARDITDRKRLEEALRASELQFRTLADTTSAAIFLYAEDDRITYVNPAATVICGFSREELLTKSLWDLVAPEFHEGIRARRRSRTPGDTAAPRAEVRIVTRDGADCWVDYTAGFLDIGGRRIAVGTAFDITERKRAEQAIRRERDFSEATLNSLPGVFYLYDRNLRFLRWNRNFEEVVGYSHEEIGRLSPLDLFEGDEKALLADRIWEVFATGASSVEASFVTKYGARIPYYFTGHATRIGDTTCLIGTGIDITPRKEAERAVLETQRRLEEAQARARLGSWEIDPQSRRGFWSKEMYHLYDRDPSLGPPRFAEFMELTHPEDRDAVGAAYEECVRTGRASAIEFRALTPDGTVRHLSGVVDCAQDETGRVTRLAGTLLDVTERKRAEAEQARLQVALRRTEIMAAMGSLVGGVAHEVRNPLFGMTATLDALDARHGEREELRPYVTVLRGELDRLGELMRDLLEYGKPYAEAFRPEPLAGVIAAALDSCRRVAEQAAVEVRAGTIPTARVSMDQTRLRLVFENLVRNAVQVSPAGSAVELTVHEVERDGATWAECTVADRGPGFQGADLDKAFEPFFTRRKGGTGLGLSIVQRIVEEHRGIVSVANRADGGAVLTVLLPTESR